MNTLANDIGTQVAATAVQFQDETMQVSLSDGRAISIPLKRVDWLQWLAEATPEQRAKWSIEPGGFAVYWEGLDDGFEIAHLLSLQSLI